MACVGHVATPADRVALASPPSVWMDISAKILQRLNLLDLHTQALVGVFDLVAHPLRFGDVFSQAKHTSRIAIAIFLRHIVPSAKYDSAIPCLIAIDASDDASCQCLGHYFKHIVAFLFRHNPFQVLSQHIKLGPAKNLLRRIVPINHTILIVKYD